MSDATENQTTPQHAAATPELERLAVFLGTWRSEGPSFVEGQSNETLRTSTVPMVLEETVEWLPGGFFLSRRWDGTFGETPFRGLEVVGYDATDGSYSSRFFDDHGNCPVYRVTEHDGTWTYAGDEQRATYTIDPSGDTMAVAWEWLKDGTDWRPLCELRSVKLRKPGRIEPS